MKFIRILLLAVLVAMIPLRGVMAAAMLCPPTAVAAGDAPALASSVGDLHGLADSDGHHHGGGESGTSGHDHDGAEPDSCNLCSTCCSVPPLPSAVPVVLLLNEFTAAVFPAPAVPAVSFLSDGQERPPRSI